MPSENQSFLFNSTPSPSSSTKAQETIRDKKKKKKKNGINKITLLTQHQHVKKPKERKNNSS